MHDYFEENTRETFDCSYQTKDVELDSHIVRFQIWDVDRLHFLVVDETDAVILVFDLTN